MRQAGPNWKIPIGNKTFGTDKIGDNTRHSSEPWNARDDWAIRQVRGTEKAAAIRTWLVALGSVVMFFWFVWHAQLPLFKASAGPGVYFFWLFPAISLFLFCRAIFEILRLKRFGDPVLELNAVPIPPGGSIDGRITIRSGSDNAPQFTLLLACIHRVVTNNGKNNHISETVLWSAEKTASLLSGGILPISISVPTDQPQTNRNDPFDGILWRLTVKAPFLGISFLEKYEMPIYGTQVLPLSEDARSAEHNFAGSEPEKAVPVSAKKAAFQSVLLLSLLIPFLILGLVLFSYGISDIRKAVSSKDWPVTTGTIVGSDSSGDSPDITYAYTINGIPYQCSKVYPHWFWSAGSSRHVVNAFPVRSSAPVHYSPTNPQEALLWVGLHPGVFQRLICSTLILSVIILLAAMCVSAPRGTVRKGNTIYFRKDSLEAKVAGPLLLLMLGQGIVLWFIT